MRKKTEQQIILKTIPMKYNNLGNTGLLVSELCLGAMTFGGRGRWKAIGEQSQQEAEHLMRIALDGGINFFDNANAYSEGLAEKIMDKLLKTWVFLAMKL